MIDKDKPVIALQVQTDLGERTSFVFTTSVDRDGSQAELDAIMDKARLAGDRQKKWFRVEGLKKDAENFLAQAEVISRAIAALDEKYAEKAAAHTGRGEYAGMNKTEASQRQETVQNLEYHMAGAKKAQHEIVKLLDELEPSELRKEAAE